MTVCMLMMGGCATMKPVRVSAVALTVQDVARAAAKQSELGIVREGTPAYLMLVEGLLESYPENKDLLIAASQGYGSYASSFVAEESPAAAEALYRKAKNYGFRALSGITGQDFGKASAGKIDEFTALLQRLKKDDAPVLFWTASAWASWIASRAGSVDAMADLPMLEATMKRALELDDTFYYGGPHLLMGTYLAAKPAIMGGNPARAREHFERAFALGGDRLLMSKVLFAQYYATAVNDRALFVKTLEEVLAAPADTVPELTLGNTVARKKAKQLLEKADELFQKS